MEVRTTLANWTELRSFLGANYSIGKDFEGGQGGCTVYAQGLTTDQTFLLLCAVTQTPAVGEPYVAVEVVIGTEETTHFGLAARVAATIVGGGVLAEEGTVSFRTARPLSSCTPRMLAEMIVGIGTAMGIYSGALSSGPESTERPTSATESNQQDSKPGAQPDDDPADEHFDAGLEWLGSDLPRALAEFETAARAGHVEAMYAAGCCATDLDRPNDAEFWWSTAAMAGHAKACTELGRIAFRTGDHEEARRQFTLATQRGDQSGFIALVAIAEAEGDAGLVSACIRQGADAGEPYCLGRFALDTYRQAGGDLKGIQAGLQLATQSAEGGNELGMYLAGVWNADLGNREVARSWLIRAREAGHKSAGAALERYNL